MRKNFFFVFASAPALWCFCVLVLLCLGAHMCFSEEAKQPNVAGQFYPDNPKHLAVMIEGLLDSAQPEPVGGAIFALICPHAGYGFSGPTASFAYKLIRNGLYKTVVVIGSSHHLAFQGVSVYPKGAFSTPLGDLKIDSAFASNLLSKHNDVFFQPKAFDKEHSIEVQLPFLQRTLSDFRIVPIIMGDCTLAACKNLAVLLKEAIGKRDDVLVIASTDMYHGYDYEELESVDKISISYLEKMDAEGLYWALRENKAQMCGGFPVVTTLLLARELGHNTLKVLNHTNSAGVTGKNVKGVWTVGYASCAIDQEKGEGAMLSDIQRKRLLEIARASIETYLKTGKRLEVKESDPVLVKIMGAFVTLHKHGQLRGCIGNIIGEKPLYLTVRDMAVEAAVGDSRFPNLTLSELKDVDIEISALSPLEKVDSAEKIILGTHGVIVKKGFQSGVFLPQVAVETGWSKEEFLSALCSHKAGLPANAWKDPSTELYVFTAEVFSEKIY